MPALTTPQLDLIVTWFQRVWTEEDASAIDEMFVDDGESHGLGAQKMIGPRDFKVFHAALLRLLSDVRIEIGRAVEQDDWISYVGTLTAVSRQTGEPVQMNGGAMCRIKDGKIVEAYNTWDFLGLFAALGLAPEDAFARGLDGNAVCGG